MRDRWLQRIEAVIQRHQRVAPERDDRRFLGFGKGRGMRGLRPGLHILDCRPLAPLRDRLRVDPQLSAQHRERSLRSLYCCSDGVRGRGAPVTNLSHMASFHSKERIAPSNRGIKHPTSASSAPAFNSGRSAFGQCRPSSRRECTRSVENWMFRISSIVGGRLAAAALANGMSPMAARAVRRGRCADINCSPLVRRSPLVDLFGVNGRL